MRQKVTFWLNTSNPEDELLIAMIATLKKRRAFTRTIRDGLRQSAPPDVLHRFFPTWVHHALGTSAAAPVAGGTLTMKEIAMPTFDDDDTLVIRADGRAAASNMDNFLNSLAGLQQKGAGQ